MAIALYRRVKLSCVGVQEVEDDENARVLRVVVDQGPVEMALLVVFPALLLLQNLNQISEKTTFDNAL
jgi:hypothetical protein